MSPSGYSMSNRNFLNTNSVSGIISLILAIALFVFIPSQVPSVALGTTSKIIPYALAYIFLICGIGLILQGIYTFKGKQFIINRETVKISLSYIIYASMFVIYTVLLRYLGFLISTIFISTMILVNYKIKKVHQYIIVYLFIILINWAFINLVKISLPRLF